MWLFSLLIVWLCILTLGSIFESYAFQDQLWTSGLSPFLQLVQIFDSEDQVQFWACLWFSFNITGLQFYK